MKKIACNQCGANELREENGYFICKYCGTMFSIGETDLPVGKSVMGIGLRKDVQNLLEKCVTDPKNAKKYANLALDIDPGNKEALRFL